MAFLRASLLAFSALLMMGVGGNAEAAEGKHHHRHHHKSEAQHPIARHLRQAVAGYARPQPSSFIIDADTGKILESENADSPRYPASLTKMMTLYLTFDALQKGTLHLNQTIPVSAHAASMPQTNLALQAGQTITVKDAILSIVIRSANDSAVTLGEALGGSEGEFAEKMTQTARKLGMDRTVFYNASGLPQPAQHTTARDMATLGLALRRHFPQYFPFFKTESFSYQGRTYVTHNHVMTRYEGVDGIKTGFIRASGFNLVTSATRGGHHLIGVVMGGSTWRARDDKMIALLDKQFTDFARLDGGKNIQFAARARPAPASLAARLEQNEEAQEGEGDVQGDDVKTISARRASVNEQALSLAPTPSAAELHWGIQVGAFARAQEATNAASRAARLAPQELGSSLIHVTAAGSATAIHRAQLLHLSQAQAETACTKLGTAHQPCFAYKVD